MPLSQMMLDWKDSGLNPTSINLTVFRVAWRLGHKAGQLESASQPGGGEADQRDAARWRTFERALRTGHLRGAAYGRRFKIIETCPMSGDEKEFNAFVEAIDTARAAPSAGNGGAEG